MDEQRSLALNLCLLVALGTFVSCSQGPVGLRVGYDKKADTGNSKTDVADLNRVVGFDEVNEKVFKVYCTVCHTGNKDPYMASSADYRSFKNEIRVAVIERRTMPKKKTLAQNEIALVKAWLDQGMQEKSAPGWNESPKEPVPEPTKEPAPVKDPTWDDVKTKILEKSCNDCHFANNKDGLSDYTDPATVRSTVGSIYYTTVISPVMPPAPKDWDESKPNPNQLTREQKEILSQWIIGGMQ